MKLVFLFIPTFVFPYQFFLSLSPSLLKTQTEVPIYLKVPFQSVLTESKRTGKIFLFYLP